MTMVQLQGWILMEWWWSVDVRMDDDVIVVVYRCKDG
jgi:hypothetical protein